MHKQMSPHVHTAVDSSRRQALWNAALSQIEPKMNPVNFSRWFRPLRCLDITENTVVVEAPNSYLKDWFEANFLKDLSLAFQAILGRPTEIQLVLAPTPRKSPARMAPHHTSLGSRTRAGTSRSLSSSKPPSRPPLPARYTFDTFVVGPSNQLAEAAARTVAQDSGSRYNPLFIYGGVGLGKTHLLCAIGNKILLEHPDWKVRYLTTDQFITEFINSVIRNDHGDTFRNKYRKDCDILLVDDIQFLAGKDRTQEEFFHVFNALYEAGRQIVLTSDRFPQEIPGLEDRLRTRFQWGLIADIQPPELETRKAIVQQKARLAQMEISEEVALFLAESITDNVRRIEGALVRLSAYARLQGKAITLELTQRALEDFLRKAPSTVTIDVILKETSSQLDVKVSDIKGRRRHKKVAYARQMAMYLSRKLTDKSYPDIGRAFGGKDHSTVVAAVKKIERLLEEDATTRSEVDMLVQKLTRR